MADEKGFDALAFKNFERQGWDSVADVYGDTFAALSSQCISPMLGAAGVGPGVRVLDVACGPGVVAAGAHARGAAVTAVDIAPNMIAQGQKTNPGPDYRQGDAEDLPFDDSSFDAVVCNFGVLHFPDPDRALAETFRVLRSGGRLAFTDWCPPKESPYFSILVGAIQTHGTMDVPLPPGPPMYRFSDAQESLRTVRGIGFSEIATTKIPVISDWTAGEAIWRAFSEGAVRLGGVLRAQTEENMRKIEQAVLERARHYQSDGHYRLPMPALMTSARKP